jgi:aspartate-semialdehyde dehydrogenase
MSDNQYNVAVVGATGAVGTELLSILAERSFPIGRLHLLASSRGSGRRVQAMGGEHLVADLAGFEFDDVDVAFFSAGTEVSRANARRATAAGALVIDNTNAFRMDACSPLVVPQVNGHLLRARPANGIVANPNCSTIQMVRVLDPLDKLFNLQQVYCSTYQAASGAGLTGIKELKEHAAFDLAGEALPPPVRFPAELAFSVIPQVDVFMPSGATLEEQKMRQETRKILGRDDIQVFPFAVRVPVVNGHSEALVLRFGREVILEDALAALESTTMLKVYRDQTYPDIRLVSGSNDVHVGRVHLDPDDPFVLYAWVAADNIRVGAALNAVDIAEAACGMGMLQ